MKSPSPERVIALVSVVVPMTLLILGLSAPKPGVPRSARIHAVGQMVTRPGRVAGPGCTMNMNSRQHIRFLIHGMISNAVAIADRL
jgi:hypothetical protein